MRPIRLDFKGLRSYRAATTIDFSDLDLFAIIGDTGAGKSTVIEALSLALYGRKTWTGGSNLEELIADGENTMAIELVFVAEGNEWTVTRSRHRNSSAPINKLECRATGEKVDGNRAVNERVEELLGLDHSQFVRAVVLPQGRFDELLQATRTDRNKILRSIFGLDDLRRVRDDATRRRDSWRPVLLEAGARRDALPVDPAAALAAAVQTAEVAKQRQLVLTAVINDLDHHHRDNEQRGERLRLLQQATADFAPDRSVLTALGELAKRAGVLLAEREQLSVTQAAAEAQRDRSIAEQAEVLRGFDNHRQARDAVSLLRSVAANLVDLDTDARAAAGDIERLTAQAPSATEPSSITAALEAARTERDTAEAAAEAARTALTAATQSWQLLRESGIAVETDRAALDAAQAAADTARTDAAVAGAGVASAESALESAKTANAEAMRANAAVVAASGLAAGDPCPVCARDLPHEFVVPDAADVDSAAGRVLQAETLLASARRSATMAETTTTHRTEALSAARAALDASLVKVGEARAAALAASVDPDADSEAVALAGHQESATSATVVLEVAAAAVAAAEQARVAGAAERAAALAAHERELTAAQQRIAKVETRRASQLKPLEQFPSAWQLDPVSTPDGSTPDGPTPDGPTPDVLEAQASSLEAMLAELDALIGAASHADTEVANARQRFADLRADAVENVNTPATDVVRQLNNMLSSASSITPLLDDGFGSDPLPEPLETPVLLDHLSSLLPTAERVLDAMPPIDAAARSAIERLQRERADAERQIASMLETAGVPDVGALHAQAGAAEGEASRARADIAVLEQQQAAASRLDAMLEIGRPYLANLELLIQSLRDQHFVDHLVSAREAELLGEATRRLKAISDGRYGFVPDFGVVRIASGEVRSPDTLSGGERFQAALSLALALVEIASRGAGKLDAVFVDEGFGSLDGAALDTALDTLGSVAGGGKLVALISHLHPVAEYVDTVFNVTKDDLFGSTITKLDAEAREALLDDDIRSGLTS